VHISNNKCRVSYDVKRAVSLYWYREFVQRMLYGALAEVFRSQNTCFKTMKIFSCSLHYLWPLVGWLVSNNVWCTGFLLWWDLSVKGVPKKLHLIQYLGSGKLYPRREMGYLQHMLLVSYSDCIQSQVNLGWGWAWCFSVLQSEAFLEHTVYFTGNSISMRGFQPLLHGRLLEPLGASTH
jgi:hypothetical protein